MPYDDPLVLYKQLAPEFNIHYRRKTISDKCKVGEFPMPLQLSSRRIAWRYSDIVKWLDSRPRKPEVQP
jgi:hypothetical protein